MIRSALDFSGNIGSFLLQKDDETIIDISITASARESSKLSAMIVEKLNEKNIKISEIDEWTVGSGPGSFTGLRLAASFVSGATLSTDKKTRCVAGAVALVASAKTQAKEVACIYDGRNKEIIYFGLEKVGNEYVANNKNAILNKELAEEFFANISLDIELFALEQDFDAVTKIVPEGVFARVKTVEKLDLQALLDCKSVEFDNDLCNLVYIRPATSTDGKK